MPDAPTDIGSPGLPRRTADGPPQPASARRAPPQPRGIPCRNRGEARDDRRLRARRTLKGKAGIGHRASDRPRSQLREGRARIGPFASRVEEKASRRRGRPEGGVQKTPHRQHGRTNTMTGTIASPYGVAGHPCTPEGMAACIEASLGEAEGDARFIAGAPGDITAPPRECRRLRATPASPARVSTGGFPENAIRPRPRLSALRVVGAPGLELRADTVVDAGATGAAASDLAADPAAPAVRRSWRAGSRGRRAPVGESAGRIDTKFPAATRHVRNQLRPGRRSPQHAG